MLLGDLKSGFLGFADDVVIIARSSEEDVEHMLVCFEMYSDESHQLTSLTKTEAMFFSFEGDKLMFHKRAMQEHS